MGRTSTRSAEAEPPRCSAHSRVNHTAALLRDRAQSLPGRAPVTAAFPQGCPVPRRALAAVPKRDTLHPIPPRHPQERRELNRQQESRSRCVHPPPAGPLRAAGALRGAGLGGGRRGAAGSRRHGGELRLGQSPAETVNSRQDPGGKSPAESLLGNGLK